MVGTVRDVPTARDGVGEGIVTALPADDADVLADRNLYSATDISVPSLGVEQQIIATCTDSDRGTGGREPKLRDDAQRSSTAPVSAVAGTGATAPRRDSTARVADLPRAVVPRAVLRDRDSGYRLGCGVVSRGRQVGRVG
jgi:hypothetical protein